MKKLIIAAAIVCAAVVSQAAQIKWTAGQIKDYKGENLYNGTATLYVSLLTESGGDIVSTQTYTGSFVDGLIKDGSKIGLTVGDGSSATAGYIQQGNYYDVYYTIDDGAGHLFTSSTKKNVLSTYTAAAGTAFGTTGSWAAVPEPTSGLLLLLGVAGLALRRRRA